MAIKYFITERRPYGNTIPLRLIEYLVLDSSGMGRLRVNSFVFIFTIGFIFQIERRNIHG